MVSSIQRQRLKQSKAIKVTSSGVKAQKTARQQYTDTLIPGMHSQLVTCGGMLPVAGWGKEALAACSSTADDKEVQNKIAPDILRNGSITAAFERKGNGKWMYSNRPLMCAKTKAEIVRWVCKSLHPFDIVSNTHFLMLMKTGHPEFYIPSPWTVSHDIQLVFVHTHEQIARMLMVSLTFISNIIETYCQGGLCWVP